jgi:hypothetical protein
MTFTPNVSYIYNVCQSQKDKVLKVFMSDFVKSVRIKILIQNRIKICESCHPTHNQLSP